MHVLNVYFVSFCFSYLYTVELPHLLLIFLLFENQKQLKAQPAMCWKVGYFWTYL